MRVLVTGSSGHLGEALVQRLTADGHAAHGIDIVPAPTTHQVASIANRAAVREALRGVDAVLHAATLHKPHVESHGWQDFIEANVTGTMTLLEESAAAGVRAFVYTSTTSAFGRALSPAEDQPAAWITEQVAPVPKNIYGVTKVAAENLCELAQRQHGLPCVVLRTSRFFPEDDDDAQMRAAYDADNAKINELLYRRVDLADVVDAHLCALSRAAEIGFGRFIVSATTPFTQADLAALRSDAPLVLQRYFPEYEAIYQARGFRMFDRIDRVYVNDLARRTLGWEPRYDFARALVSLREGRDHRSPLALAIGSKGYGHTR